MKLSQVPMLVRHAEARDQLVRQLAALRNGDICVTISCERQDDTVLALVRPVLDCEIRARIAEIDRDIVALGVTVA